MIAIIKFICLLLTLYYSIWIIEVWIFLHANMVAKNENESHEEYIKALFTAKIIFIISFALFVSI